MVVNVNGTSTFTIRLPLIDPDTGDWKSGLAGTILSGEAKITYRESSGPSWTTQNASSVTEIGTSGLYVFTFSGGLTNLVTSEYGVLSVIDATATKAWKDTGINIDFNNNISVINDIYTDTQNIVGDLPTVGPIASQGDVQALQNNTKLRISISPCIQIPETGDNAIPVDVFFYDSDGVLTDPDSNEIAINAYAVNAGTSKNSFYDDSGLTSGSTSSTTFTPNYYKMVRLSIGSYKIYYKMESTETPDYWTFTVKLKENTNDIAGSVNIQVVTQLDTIELEDNVTNRTIIAKSLKTEDVSGISEVSGSVYKDLNDQLSQIVGKLPSGSISGLDLSTTIDGVTVEKILELSMAMMDGRILKDSPNPGDLTFFRRDNSTILTITRTTETERTRIAP